MDFTKYIGIAYPPPHGCLTFVSQLLRDEYGRPVPDDITERAAEVLQHRLAPVETPAEGDALLIKANQWHVALVLAGGMMIHAAPPDGTVMIERYDGLQWKARTRGFYRWIS